MVSVPPGYRRIDGSERKIASGARLVGRADPAETFGVMICVRRRPEAPPLLDIAHWMKTPPGKRKFLSREEFAAQYGAAQSDIDKVTKFARSHGLKVLETSLAKRSVSVSGTVKQMNKAFGVALGYYQQGEARYRSREGYVHIPEELHDIVKDVFGLDNRPVGRRHNSPNNQAGTQLMTPPWVAQLYNFPTTGAQGQTIGLIELWGGFQQSDINYYFGRGGSQGMQLSPLLTPNTPNPFPNLTPPTPVVFPVSNMGVSGGNNPGVNQGDDAEVMLDICVASSVAQDPSTGDNAANIVVYFAPHTGMGGVPQASDWAATILAAVNDAQNKPSVISFSWSGGAEDIWWTAAHMNTVDEAFQSAAMMGVTVLVTSGDNGSDDALSLSDPANNGKAHVEFPASDPWVTTCGGTIISQVSGHAFKESTWSELGNSSAIGEFYGTTGGGVSSIFPLPDYQADLNPAPQSANPGGNIGRGVPDISGNASDYSGYAVVLEHWFSSPFPPLKDTNGVPFAFGGTSVVAPLYAALVAILNASLGAPIGFLNPTLYSLGGDPSVFNYIGDGANNEDLRPGETSAPYYTSVPGKRWNACTGLGSVDGTNLLNAMIRISTAAAPNLYFVVEKNVFGVDEVLDTSTWPNAFSVAVEGFTPNQLNLGTASPTTPTLSGPFSSLQNSTGGSAVSISPNASGPIAELPAQRDLPQRILFPYDVAFRGITAMSITPFPAPESQPGTYELDAAIAVQGAPPGAAALFELVAGQDPYFTNVGPLNNVFWLSQDLRVFTVTPGINSSPITGTTTGTVSLPTWVPTPSINDPTKLDTAAAFNFIKSVISYLNSEYSTPTSPANDPLNYVLPAQAGVLFGESSVTPTSPNPNAQNYPYINYNFAIARVRLKAKSGSPPANNVKVFFRLFLTQSNDTDFQPSTTYASNPPMGPPESPSVDSATDTIPFFATGNYSSSPVNTDYVTGGVNNQSISVPANADSVWAYFGCFLNVYDPNNVVNGLPVNGSASPPKQGWLEGTHHCLVAQIAYEDAPIVSTATFTPSPENFDELAQRNLQVTTSDNPGPPAAHRIPQTFDTRTSLRIPKGSEGLLKYPDELMIEWGDTPAGSMAQIYWPGASAMSVLQLAERLYTTHQLSATDDHTVQCRVAGAATYLPIPEGAGEKLAGLLTVDLPSGVRRGQEFNIVIHRISTRQAGRPATHRDNARAAAAGEGASTWRYVVGTFQVRIPVSTKEALLPSEESVLAIMKWRLKTTPKSDRWHPVLERYVSYLSARVDGMGGDANKIGPSWWGLLVGGGERGDRVEYTGKVSGLIYDRFGDFEGFLLRTEGGDELRFESREREIEELVYGAWDERMVISVFVNRRDERWPVSIVLRRAPRPFEP